MDPDAVADVPRVPHGGASDSTLLDFSANTNPERPRGIAGVYESAYGAATQYPGDDYCEFRTAAGEYLGCEPLNVAPTAGGIGALRLAFEVTLETGDDALLPKPSFAEYEREVRLQGVDPTFIAHDRILGTDPSPYDVVVVCNPNNPTGDGYPQADLLAFAQQCRAADTVLVVDEAFLDFTDRRTLAGEPGVIVARSLTKIFGLPGLRAGLAVATDGLRERLDAARPVWGLSTPAADVGTYCFRQTKFVAETRDRVRRERERMADRLAAAYEVYPSEAPFLLLGVHDRSVSEVIDAARREGIVVRDATTFRDLDSHVRVAVRRPNENDRLLDALL
ncbi:aminotransferase class I/II-fold pyridoxal phosphate-dependent enzyme [Haloplanus aerogenes]|uniref:Aminotransferase n=1 Tax=Haloplanus aerogenes TaxID=660522 RepID=A0A3M0DPK4_9EURY|nr:aminotransferase class I/II-fold pyridoxal phosphate-dependent enzyme [Haloplanus aerogenes]AZH24576.1 pyridoxal phosphate-dependent class II aminotransferase [Haloplanus aerogenes]RMB23768.1 L-threonine O-3-phosphate decarboxylase [Haloplanus aerogenes]